MKTIIIFALTLAASAFGQQTIEGVTYTTDALEASRRFVLAQPTQVSTTLAAPVLAAGTAYTLASAAGLAVGDQLLCEGDAAIITAINGNVVTVTRATLGTTAADHAQNVTVQQLKYRSIQHLFRLVRIEVAKALLAQYGSQTVDAQKAAINTANAAIIAAQNAAAQ